MAKKEAYLNSFSLAQELAPELWNWSEKGKELIKNKDLKKLTDYIIFRLENVEKWTVEEAYSIIHNEDKRTVWSEAEMAYVAEEKLTHVHICIKFKKGQNNGATLNKIAEIVGLEPNYIEKPKSGRYSWDNQLAYLTHAKDGDKHQYTPDEVYTFKGTSYKKIYMENIDRWLRGRASKEKNKITEEDATYLESLILQGKIFKNQILLTDEYYKIYCKNKRLLDEAFDSYAQRKIARAEQRLENGETSIKVYYIMGKPGKGKTHFANNLIKNLITEAKEKFNENWTVCKTASLNPVDDYMGEEILFMDDVRGSTMRADDWIKLIDPWNLSPSSARFHNKTVASQVIIITATMNPVEFFYYTKGVGMGKAQTEAIDQFIRRLMGIIKIIDYNDFEMLRSVRYKDKLPVNNAFDTSDKIATTSDQEFSILSENKNLKHDEIIEKLTNEILEENFKEKNIDDFYEIYCENYLPIVKNLNLKTVFEFNTWLKNGSPITQEEILFTHRKKVSNENADIWIGGESSDDYI